jgi:PAS domain S-box-containing protein
MPARSNSTPVPSVPLPRIRAGWVPVVVGVVLCLMVGGLWWTLEEREQRNLRAKVQSQADYLAEHVTVDLADRIPFLQRMALRWELRGGIPKEEFVSDVRAYMADVPGFQAIGWVDKDFIFRWVVPTEGNEKAQDLNLAFEERRRVALFKAKNTKAPTVTAPVDLVLGGRGFLVYVPVSIRGEFNGFILAVFRIQEWLDYVFGVKVGRDHPSTLERFKISVRFDDLPVYEQRGLNSAVAALDSAAYTRILDHHLSIHARPTPGFLAENRTMLPRVTAGLGVLLSLLLAFIVYLLQKAFEEAWATHAARVALEAESVARKKTDAELRSVVSRLDLAIQAGEIGVWTWDIATGKLAWNDRMYALHDIPRDVSPSYDTWRNSLHPEDAAAAESLLKRAVEGKAVFNMELRIVDSTGAVRHVITAARVQRGSGGNPETVTGVSWDVTQRRETEQNLRKSEEQVRLLLNSAGEGIYGIDLTGICTFANPSCLRILGYADSSQVLGKNMHYLIHHTDAAGHPIPIEMCRVFQAFTHGRSAHMDDEVFWRADGTSFPAEYWSYPQILNGKVAGAVVAFVDITERKRTEEEQKQLVAKLQKALDEIKTLSGIVPICASCKKIRDDKGFWEQVEAYVARHTDAQFSHSICPDCAKKLYPELYEAKMKSLSEREAAQEQKRLSS